MLGSSYFGDVGTRFIASGVGFSARNRRTNIKFA